MTFNLWPSNSLRTSLVFIGGSVCWGLYRDQSSQYVTQLQRFIDASANVATYLNSWPVRVTHADDWQSGADADHGAFNAGDISNYGIGSSSEKMKPVGGYNTPLNKPFGIFGGHTGSQSGATWHDPGVSLLPSNCTLRIYVPTISPNWTNAPTYLFVGASCTSGSGSLDVWGWGNGTHLGTINYINNPGSIAQYYTSWTDPQTAGPWILDLVNSSGYDVYLHYVIPTRGQATRHIQTQVVARDSYNLQDYLGNSFMPDGSWLPTAKLIGQSVFNAVSGYSTAPIYVIFDSYNSMVQVGAPSSGWADRRLSSAEYKQQVRAFAKALIAYSPSGLQGSPRIILTNPVAPYVVGSTTSEFGAGGDLAWLTNESSSTYGSALSALATDESWSYMDQNDAQWGTNLVSTDWESDGIHPKQSGVDKIAQKWKAYFGL